MSTKMTSYVVSFYAVLVFAGGLMGFLKAQSFASLAMGSLFSIFLLSSSIGMKRRLSWGFYGALSSTSALLFFFSFRFYQSLKFMPAGLMVMLSVGVLFVLIFQKLKKTTYA